MTSDSPSTDRDRRWNRATVSRRLPLSTSWLRRAIDVLALVAVPAFALWSDPAEASLGVPIGWLLLRTAAALRPARIEFAVAPDRVRFYRFDDPEGVPRRFRGRALELDRLDESGAPAGLAKLFPGFGWWFAVRVLLGPDRRERLRSLLERHRRDEGSAERRESIAGNPAETVGETRMQWARESSEALEFQAVPQSVREVLAEYLTGTYVLIAMALLLGLYATVAELLDTLYLQIDADLVFAVAVAGTVVVLSILFFVVVQGDDDSSGEHPGRPLEIVVGPEQFEVRRERPFGGFTGFRADSLTFVDRLRTIERSRIGPSSVVVSVLRPLSSVDSVLIASFTDRDRNWLVRQVVTEDD